MENNISADGVPKGRDASQVLAELDSDRERLAEKARSPWWLAPGFGLIAAAYVSIPAFPWEESRTFVFIAAIVASILLIAGYHRATGIKIARFGAREWAAYAVALVLTLVLLSVAFGLSAAGLGWWVAAPAVAAFAVVTWLASLVYSSVRDRLRHDG